MKCPHCDKEITEEDELISDALRAACPDRLVEQMKYTSKEEVGFAARGTFVVDGDLREFTIAFDQYHRLTHFQQEKNND